MAIREPIIKHNQLKINLTLQKIWEFLLQHSPAILHTPLLLFDLILQVVNWLLIVLLFLVLMGQTVHILNGSERRYINLRHLLIKWISLIVVLTVADQVKKHTSYDEMFELVCNLCALSMVYPSKFIKNLHLKYFSFSEKKKYEQSVEDISQLEVSLITRMISSITVFLLNVCRFMITFIAPQQRKKIEEAMRGINLVIVQEKYFWKMYETNTKNSIVMPSPTELSGLQSLGSLTKSRVVKRSYSTDMMLSKSPISTQSAKDANLTAKVSEYIEIPITSLKSVADRKFTFYRNIEIAYCCETGQLTVTNEEDGKSITHSLIQFNEESSLLLKFGFQDEDEPLFVKFRNKREYDLFYNTLYLQAQHQGSR